MGTNKLGSIIRRLRTDSKETQPYLASILGCSRSTISMYESGSREPNFETLEAIADHYNVDMNFLLGKTNTPNSQNISFPSNIVPYESTQIPLVGTIACGAPILADGNIEEYIDLPKHIRADFALTCKGDSMIGAGIKNGDVVYIRKQSIVENGQIAAILIEDEATLKRFYKEGNEVYLQAENPAFRPLHFKGSELNELQIIGLAVAYTHSIIDS